MTVKDVVSEGFRLLTERENDARILDAQVDILIDSICNGWLDAVQSRGLNYSIVRLKSDDLNLFLMSHIAVTTKGC